MRCIISCSSTSFPWLIFFFAALLWVFMIHKHTGRWMWQGSTSFVSWKWEKCSCHSKASRRWRQHHNQIDYILVKKHFLSGVNDLLFLLTKPNTTKWAYTGSNTLTYTITRHAMGRGFFCARQQNLLCLCSFASNLSDLLCCFFNNKNVLRLFVLNTPSSSQVILEQWRILFLRDEKGSSGL